MTIITDDSKGNYNLGLELGAPAAIGGMSGPVTVDVSNGAVMSSHFTPYEDNESLTFNVSNATLVLEDGAWIAGATGTPVINLSENSVLDLNPESGRGATVIFQPTLPGPAKLMWTLLVSTRIEEFLP